MEREHSTVGEKKGTKSAAELLHVKQTNFSILMYMVC
jgi:hypothetical protein